MFSKLSTRTLLILMAVLAVVVWFTYFSDSGSDESTFRSDFMTLDTGRVTSILLYPKADNHREIRFTRADGTWQLSNDMVTTSVDSQTVAGLLGSFAALKSQSLAAASRDQWDTLQVGDSTATRIKFVTPDKTWDVMVGKFGYNNQTRGGITYVRMHGEDEVYTVDGFLSFSVNQPFNSWRNRSLTKGQQQHWKKITFMYPADSGFAMVRDTAGWSIGGTACDSAEAASYVQSIANLNSTEFLDGYSPGANMAAYGVRIEGDNQSTILLQAYPADSTVRFALHSSLNPDAYFNDAKSGIAEKLFVGKGKFLK